MACAVPGPEGQGSDDGVCSVEAVSIRLIKLQALERLLEHLAHLSDQSKDVVRLVT